MADLEELALQGTVTKIPLERLCFDPDNPRLPRSFDPTDDQAVLEYMLRDATLTDLMGSIGENGYFPGEPVLVAPLEGEVLDLEHGTLRVVEGNRRLAAVTLLNHPDQAPARAQTVATLVSEAQVFPKELPVIAFEDRSQILDYLGYRHITGVDAWDALAKARYLKQLLGTPPKTENALKPRLRVLAKKIGSYNRTDYVLRLLNGLTLYEHAEERDFYGLNAVDEDSVDFGVLTTAIGYAAIRGYLKASSSATLYGTTFSAVRSKKLFAWLFETRANGTTVLGESRNLRDLAAVVESPSALRLLSGGRPLSEARLQTGEPVAVFRASLEAATERVRMALSNAAIVAEFESNDLDNTIELRSIARALITLVQNRLDEDEA